MTHPWSQAAQSRSQILRRQHCCDCNVTAAHQFTVRLNAHFIAQTIRDQRLVCFRKAQLHGVRILNGTSGGCSRSAVVPEIRMTCAPAFATPAATVPPPASDTSFTEIRAFYLHFTVINQLCKVLDRIDIVVRRRRDRTDARCRMPRLLQSRDIPPFPSPAGVRLLRVSHPVPSLSGSPAHLPDIWR